MRIVSLDFLRFFAAFSVAVPHLIIYFSITDDLVLLETITSLAVELFFVLSGFVLCPFLKKIFESTTGVGRNLLIFLVRRWMRTLPLYFLSLTFFVILFSGRLDLTAVKYLVFLQNFLCRRRNSIIFRSPGRWPWRNGFISCSPASWWCSSPSGDGWPGLGTGPSSL